MVSPAKTKSQLLMGFDFGTKKIGVAIGQMVTKSARPLKSIKSIDGLPNKEIVAKLLKDWRPDALVVGIPINMDGTDQPISILARNLANWLRENFKLTVYETDERLTTKAAREQIFNEGGYKALQDGQVDSVAAQLILQNWMASKNED